MLHAISSRDVKTNNNEKNKIALKKQKKQNKDFTEEISALKTHNSYMEKQVQDLTNDSIARYDYQFTIFRGNILLDLIRKLLPEEAKQARHRATGIKGSTLAENYAEADFKEATKKFDVCNESAHMMEIFQKFGSVSLFGMPRALIIKSTVY